MFESLQQRENASGSVSIDIAPLIDMMFTLLLFLLVTTTFVNDSGIIVSRPSASRTKALSPQSMRIVIAASGLIYTEGRQLNLDQCREAVHRFIAQDQDGVVIIIPDENVPSGRLVAVIDVAKQGGSKEIAVATRSKGTNHVRRKR